MRELIGKGVVVYQSDGHVKVGTLINIEDGYLDLRLDNGRIEHISTSGTVVKQKAEEQGGLRE